MKKIKFNGKTIHIKNNLNPLYKNLSYKMNYCKNRQKL